MPAGSASWELRKGIILRLGLAIATLGALMLAWYAVNSDERHAPLEIAAPATPAAGTSVPATSKATTAQSITTASVVREEPATLPIEIPPPQEKKVPDAHDLLHSEGIIRTLRHAASEKAESQHAAPAPAAQPTAKPKLPGGAYVQVGVFSHPANAAELKAKLEAQGIPVVIATRVQVGPFKSKKEAEEMRAKLKAMGMAAIVINQ